SGPGLPPALPAPLSLVPAPLVVCEAARLLLLASPLFVFGTLVTLFFFLPAPGLLRALTFYGGDPALQSGKRLPDARHGGCHASKSSDRSRIVAVAEELLRGDDRLRSATLSQRIPHLGLQLKRTNIVGTEAQGILKVPLGLG